MYDITVVILKYHLEAIKHDVLREVLYFFTCWMMIKLLNHMLHWYQRGGNHDTQWLPITYKLISLNQCSFLKGRRINNDIELSQEFHRSFNRKSTACHAFISVCFHQAFNTLQWDAVKAILELMGYNTIFKELVMTCISMTSFSTLVEGHLMDLFTSKRGVWWGEPLSPLLFIMVLEYLSKLILLEMERNELDLDTIGGTIVVSLLMFTNDVVFSIMHATLKSMNAIKDISTVSLHFKVIEVNNGKSFVVFSTSTTWVPM